MCDWLLNVTRWDYFCVHVLIWLWSPVRTCLSDRLQFGLFNMITSFNIAIRGFMSWWGIRGHTSDKVGIMILSVRPLFSPLFHSIISDLLSFLLNLGFFFGVFLYRRNLMFLMLLGFLLRWWFLHPVLLWMSLSRWLRRMRWSLWYLVVWFSRLRGLSSNLRWIEIAH